MGALEFKIINFLVSPVIIASIGRVAALSQAKKSAMSNAFRYWQLHQVVFAFAWGNLGGIEEQKRDLSFLFL
jgi:hypothetical protein